MAPTVPEKQQASFTAIHDGATPINSEDSELEPTAPATSAEPGKNVQSRIEQLHARYSRGIHWHIKPDSIASVVIGRYCEEYKDLSEDIIQELLARALASPPVPAAITTAVVSGLPSPAEVARAYYCIEQLFSPEGGKLRAHRVVNPTFQAIGLPANSGIILYLTWEKIRKFSKGRALLPARLQKSFLNQPFDEIVMRMLVPVPSIPYLTHAATVAFAELCDPQVRNELFLHELPTMLIPRFIYRMRDTVTAESIVNQKNGNAVYKTMRLASTVRFLTEVVFIIMFRDGLEVLNPYFAQLRRQNKVLPAAEVVSHKLVPSVANAITNIANEAHSTYDKLDNSLQEDSSVSNLARVGAEYNATFNEATRGIYLTLDLACQVTGPLAKEVEQKPVQSDRILIGLRHDSSWQKLHECLIRRGGEVPETPIIDHRTLGYKLEERLSPKKQLPFDSSWEPLDHLVVKIPAETVEEDSLYVSKYHNPKISRSAKQAGFAEQAPPKKRKPTKPVQRSQLQSKTATAAAPPVLQTPREPLGPIRAAVPNITPPANVASGGNRMDLTPDEVEAADFYGGEEDDRDTDSGIGELYFGYTKVVDGKIVPDLDRQPPHT